MQTCPHCRAEINIKDLRHQGLFKSYMVCPICGGSFTVDPDTKYRQAIFIFVALISLTFTLFLYFSGTEWLVPSLVSYVVLGILIYWGNCKVFFVPCKKGENSANGS